MEFRARESIVAYGAVDSRELMYRVETLTLPLLTLTTWTLLFKPLKTWILTEMRGDKPNRTTGMT